MKLNWAVKQAAFIEVTPTIAEYWLHHHNQNNRVRRASVIRQYQRDIEESQWQETGETISFDRDGQLVNGQHRLSAIILAGRSIQMLVVTGLDPKVRSYIDTQAKRSLADAMESLKDPAFTGDGAAAHYRNMAAAMWVRMMYGITHAQHPTRHQVLTFAQQHREAGAFALRLFMAGHPKKPGVIVAPVMAAFARGFYHYRERLDELEALSRAIITGIQISPRDRVSVLLVDALQGNGHAKKPANDHSGRIEAYGKTARTIKAYMDDEQVGRLYAPQTEPFPLPEEMARW